MESLVEVVSCTWSLNNVHGHEHLGSQLGSCHGNNSSQEHFSSFIEAGMAVRYRRQVDLELVDPAAGESKSSMSLRWPADTVHVNGAGVDGYGAGGSHGVAQQLGFHGHTGLHYGDK